MKRVHEMLESFGVDLWWADERSRTRDWVGTADVACSRTRLAVSVPRRRDQSQVTANIVHEVAHLLRWVQTGVSPSRHDEEAVCADALVLAAHYRLSRSAMEWLRLDAEDAARDAAQTMTRAST